MRASLRSGLALTGANRRRSLPRAAAKRRLALATVRSQPADLILFFASAILRLIAGRRNRASDRKTGDRIQYRLLMY